ncbi:recombinase RecT [Apilactobacillus sp. TMW 2.2459]|uniref:recombinase RecT n=1 Tax=Apilactobacillus xinyiensis TaxID=2841032 RepID=UPI00200EC600|nr:recombinase RecT [Apilactobacillus xinyiensis]MCL0312826.1 recombinase RecT [Apilactobacillus xinyiensis]
MNKLANVPMKTLVKQERIQEMVKATLKNKADQFLTSLVSIVNSDQTLQDVDQVSVIESAMVAASLNLPISQDLGFMWIVPYNRQDENRKWVKIAQPQMGYKGYIQLALRTDKYKKITALEVYEGELTMWNPLTEESDYNPLNRKSDTVVGYMGHLELLSGFEKTVYWSKQQMEDHKKKFSKNYDRPKSSWNTDYDAMARKTVLKNLLSKWGIMTTEMETALTNDEVAQQPKDIEAEETHEEPKNAKELLANDKKDVTPAKPNNAKSDTKGKDDSNEQSLFGNEPKVPTKSK